MVISPVYQVWGRCAISWSAPRTYTTGELFTAAIGNQHIRDNFNVVNPTAVSLTVDGGGAAITTGSKLMFSAPFPLTIDQWDIYTPGEASSIQFAVYAVSYGGFPPAGADSISGGSPILTSSAAKGQDTNPSAWSAISQGETVALIASAVSGVTKAFVTLWFNRT